MISLQSEQSWKEDSMISQLFDLITSYQCHRSRVFRGCNWDAVRSVLNSHPGYVILRDFPVVGRPQADISAVRPASPDTAPATETASGNEV
jgi:hypothetical protein